MATRKKEVVAAQDHAIAERPDWMNTDSERGSEQVSMDHVTVPRLQIVQDLSPQRKKNEAEYIEGCEEGMAFNTVSRRLYSSAGTDGIHFVPVYFKPEYVVWKHRDAGGGFLGAFDSMAEAREAAEAREEWGQQTKKGDDIIQIVDTHQQFGILMNDDGPEEIVLSMSISQMKASRQLNTMAKMAGGDRFSRMYKLTVVSDKNQSGQSYYNWKVDQLGFLQSQELYALAETMYDNIAEGKRKAEYASDPADAE